MSLQNQLEEWRNNESSDLKVALRRLINAIENQKSKDLDDAVAEAKKVLKTYYF